jgi:hypothetical protein
LTYYPQVAVGMRLVAAAERLATWLSEPLTRLDVLGL